jgi:hypothetical protein
MEKYRQITLCDFIILIPTINKELALRCIESFNKFLSDKKFYFVILDSGRNSEFFDTQTSNAVYITGNESDKLASDLSELAECPPELLFGDRSYNRTYGGAANLLFAISIGLGVNNIAKIDDDCLHICEEDSLLWYQKAQSYWNNNKVVFGEYKNDHAYSISNIPKKSKLEFIKNLYSEDTRVKKIPNEKQVKSQPNRLKNGNVILNINAAKHACYPILYNELTNVVLRGEANQWSFSLYKNGINTYIDSDLVITHEPKKIKNIMEWLKAIVTGFDYWYVCMSTEKGKFPTYKERLENINMLEKWLSETHLDNSIDNSYLLFLLKEAGTKLADTLIHNTQLREHAWSNLIKNDLRNYITKFI